MSSYGGWFEIAFGFNETTVNFDDIKNQFHVQGDKLVCLRHNNKAYKMGTFACPSLSELRHVVSKGVKPSGTVRIEHIAIGDVLQLHALPENQRALFQVASQFNCLEFAAPQQSPENGITCYEFDRTQGPACAMACGAATLYRNFLVPLGPQIGQSEHAQINNLCELEHELQRQYQDKFWEVSHGYVTSTPEKLQKFASIIAKGGPQQRDHFLSMCRIGTQDNAEVIFETRFRPLNKPEQLVHQAFCSAISCAYSRIPVDEWEALASLALDAAYEATILKAVHLQALGQGSGKVFLTMLGGGAFGNRPQWIATAIGRSLATAHHFNLDVKICHYGHIDAEMKRLIDETYLQHIRK